MRNARCTYTSFRPVHLARVSAAAVTRTLTRVQVDWPAHASVRRIIHARVSLAGDTHWLRSFATLRSHHGYSKFNLPFRWGLCTHATRRTLIFSCFFSLSFFAFSLYLFFVLSLLFPSLSLPFFLVRLIARVMAPLIFSVILFAAGDFRL